MFYLVLFFPLHLIHVTMQTEYMAGQVSLRNAHHYDPPIVLYTGIQVLSWQSTMENVHMDRLKAAGTAENRQSG